MLFTAQLNLKVVNNFKNFFLFYLWLDINNYKYLRYAIQCSFGPPNLSFTRLVELGPMKFKKSRFLFLILKVYKTVLVQCTYTPTESYLVVFKSPVEIKLLCCGQFDNISCSGWADCLYIVLSDCRSRDKHKFFGPAFFWTRLHFGTDKMSNVFIGS